MFSYLEKAIPIIIFVSHYPDWWVLAQVFLNKKKVIFSSVGRISSMSAEKITRYI